VRSTDLKPARRAQRHIPLLNGSQVRAALRWVCYGLCSSQNVKQAHHPAQGYCAPCCNGSRCTFRSQRRSAATCQNPSRSSNSQPCVAQLSRGAASAAPHRAAWRLASLQHALGLSRAKCAPHQCHKAVWTDTRRSTVRRTKGEYTDGMRCSDVHGPCRRQGWCMRASTSIARAAQLPTGVCPVPCTPRMRFGGPRAFVHSRPPSLNPNVINVSAVASVVGISDKKGWH
jgi:hypothetical protein